jgi:hypothetical protein
MGHAAGYDAELRRHHEVLLRAVGVRATDHVLDVGCGAGRPPALRPAGRLVMMVWQGGEHNEWDVAVRRSLATAALAWVRGFTCTSEALKRLDPDAANRAEERLRRVLAAHLSDDGVWFDSRAWLVTAHRRPTA